jgi:hypothetical protein
MQNIILQRLVALNRKLRGRLERLRGAPDRPAIVAPTEFTDLLRELGDGSDCCRGLSADVSADAELANEISAWRKNVEELGKLLPWVQGRLLVEKARLQALQAHITAAESWAEASRGIL